mgnify:CR=1 FL=1
MLHLECQPQGAQRQSSFFGFYSTKMDPDPKIGCSPHTSGTEALPIRPTVWKCPNCRYTNYTDLSLAMFPDYEDGQWKCVICKHQRGNAEIDTPQGPT